LRSLDDIKTVRDLNKESVRDILRCHTRDQTLEIIEMGEVLINNVSYLFNDTDILITWFFYNELSNIIYALIQSKSRSFFFLSFLN